MTYGTLAADGRNAVLLAHGYTSSHLFADAGGSASEGPWSGLVGPGRRIDTGRFNGHQAAGADAAKWAPRLADFMVELAG